MFHNPVTARVLFYTVCMIMEKVGTVLGLKQDSVVEDSDQMLPAWLQSLSCSTTTRYVESFVPQAIGEDGEERE